MNKLSNIKHKNIITVSFMLATVMQVMDTTIANIALPHIQGALSASREQIVWILTSYIVASAVATPFVGWLTCRLGVRKTLLACICFFTVTSCLCGLANSLEQMVIFRLLQGLFGAALIPLSQTILLDINPREKHGQAMAIWGMGVMIGPILGPILGGYITEYCNWRWIFFINVPAGIFSFLGIYIYLTDFGKQDTKFDVIGFALCSIFIFALQIMLDRGEQKDWFESKEIITYLNIFIVGLIVLVLYSRKKQNPFIPIKIFADKNYLVCNILMFFLGIILFSSMTAIPQLLQNLANYDVISAGLIVAPRGLGSIIAMIFVGRLVNKVNVHFLISFGLLLSAFSYYQLTLINLNAMREIILYSGIIQGFGFGFIFVPISTICFSTINPTLRAQASAIYSLIRNIGGAVGISIVIFLIGYYTKLNHALLVELVTSTSKNVLTYMQHLPTKNELAQVAIIEAEITKQATFVGYLNAFKICMLLNIAIIPLVVFLKSGEKNPREAGIVE
jgi:DHA2 family multidrug resistance protein